MMSSMIKPELERSRTKTSPCQLVRPSKKQCADQGASVKLIYLFVAPIIMNHTGHFFRSLPCLLFFASIVVAAAGDAGIRLYKLPDHGSIQLNVPEMWKDEIRQPPNGLSPTITFEQKVGAPFEVLITPIRPAKKDMPLTEEEGIRQLVLQGAELAQSQAVEKTIELKKLDGASGPGYYFSVTDREPGPGEYKYLTQGMVRVSNLVVSFTILTNDGQGKIVADAIATLKNAVYVDD